MNLNLCVCSNAKTQYINTLLKCILSLIICSICFFPELVFASPNQYTRGGGASNYSNYLTYELILKQGYVSVQDKGELLHLYGDSKFYSEFIRVDSTDYTLTAQNKKLYNLTTNFPGSYWLSFYNYNGSTVTFLGNTPLYRYIVDTEVPSNTTFIVVNSADNKLEGSVIFTGDKSNLEGYHYSFDKYNNVFELGMLGKMTYSSGSYVLPIQYTYIMPTLKSPIDSDRVASKYYFNTSVNSSYVFQNSKSHALNVTFVWYDSSHQAIGGVFKSVASNSSGTFITTLSGARYLKVFYESPTGQKYTADSWKTDISITGLENETEVYSSAYQMDTSSTGTIINNYFGSSNAYNISSGDNSPVTIVDGNNNTITIPGATPIINAPGDPVDIPGENDDSGGGIFDGIGDLLGGLLDFIMIPINLIIQTITELVKTLGDVVASTVGMSDYMGSLFSWMPQPLPGLIVSMVSAMLIIALIKFLRG